jgi:hypothetical protein
MALSRRATTRKAKTDNSRPKKMLTIAWNPLELHLLDALLKGRTFNAECYCDNILTALLQLRRQVDGRKLAEIREIVTATPKRPCRAYLTTGWRDSNRFLRTMVTIIHKLNSGEFSVL